MFYGMLKILVLESLLKHTHTGYSLMSEIEKEYGTRPSSGSMYPLLSEIQKKGFVHVHEDGRRKVYAITNKGRTHIKKILTEHQNMLQTYVRMEQAVSELIGMDCPKPNRKEFIRNSDVLIPFFKNLYRLMDNPEFRTHEKSLRKIIKETDKKIQELQ
ncbi:MAG: PadR family transcriptional regulator [Nanobdellota archaeon]